MNKDYNVDDILLEIKAKKSQQNHQERPKQNPFTQPRPEYKASQDIETLLRGTKPQAEHAQPAAEAVEQPAEKPAYQAQERQQAPFHVNIPQEEPAAYPSQTKEESFRFRVQLEEERPEQKQEEGFRFNQEPQPAQPRRTAVKEEAPAKEKEAETGGFHFTLNDDDGEPANIDVGVEYGKYFANIPKEDPFDDDEAPYSFGGRSSSGRVLEETQEVSLRTGAKPASKEPFKVNFDFDDDMDAAPNGPQFETQEISQITGQVSGFSSGKNGIFPDEMMEEEPTGKRGLFGRRKGEDYSQEPVDYQEPEEESDLDDYTSSKDKESVIRDMKMIKAGLIVRLGLMLVVFGVSLYLALSATNPALNLPKIIQPEYHLREFMIANTVVAAIGAVICSNTVGGGLLSLLRLKADTDALPSMAVIATLIQGVCFIVKPDLLEMATNTLENGTYEITTAVSLFFPAAMLILFFNIIGKLMIILRIQNNFKLVASDRTKYAVETLKNKSLLHELTKNLSMEEDLVAYPVKTKFLSNFLENSYSEDRAESLSHVLSPVCILAGIVISVLSYFFNQNVAMAVSTFAAVMCICAPFSSTIAANYPLLRLSNKMIPIGGMVAGYSSVDNFADTEGIVMKASDIFPPENVILHGIKAFDQGKIDSVILDAASVVCSMNGMLTGVFNKIIGSNRAMLRPVENVTYEDSMGLSAWVDGKRVLIGNRDLMLNHGVEVPSNDYEMRYVKDSKNIIYLSNSGELSAMFVISYNPNNDVMDELDKLVDNGMSLIVETSDPNITAEKIRDAYDFPIEQIQIMSAKVNSAYQELTEEREKASSQIGFMGSSKTMIRAICDCITIKSAIAKSVIIQMASLIIGYGIIAVFALVGDLSLITAVHIMLYQLLWTFLVLFIPNLKKL